MTVPIVDIEHRICPICNSGNVEDESHVFCLNALYGARTAVHYWFVTLNSVIKIY